MYRSTDWMSSLEHTVILPWNFSDNAKHIPSISDPSKTNSTEVFSEDFLRKERKLHRTVGSRHSGQNLEAYQYQAHHESKENFRCLVVYGYPSVLWCRMLAVMYLTFSEAAVGLQISQVCVAGISVTWEYGSL